MLRREITYEDFSDGGNTVTDVHYFHLSKTELLELEVSYGEGFQDYMQRIYEAKDRQALVAEFKKLVLMAYGVRSEDNKRFIKSDELREQFSQTAAYDALFMELAMDDGKAAEFVIGIVPKDLRGGVEAELEKELSPSPASQPTLPAPTVE